MLLVLFWVGCDGFVVSEGGGQIFADTPFDPTFDGGSDAPREVGVVPYELWPCGSVGQVGGHCRRPGNTCAAGAVCALEETLALSALGIPPGAPDPAHPGFFVADGAAPDLTVRVFSGDLCTSVCDLDREEAETPTSGELDTCGDCVACSDGGSSRTLLPPSEDTIPFGARTGTCRATCTFDPDTNGGCPTGLTCDPATLVCVDACESDDACQLALEPTRDGSLVAVLHAEGGTCNLTTGRCDRGVGRDGVGRVCSRDAECSEHVGACLDGTCTEYDCAAASDTMDGLCDGGRGVCLARAPDDASLCIEGCSRPSDCNPGNTCIPLPAAVGPYAGVCSAACDVSIDGPTDTLVPCRSDERCDMANRGPDREGLCRAPCALDTDCPLPDQRCERLGADGFCRVPDQRCSATALDADCHFGQRCDLLAQDGNDGLCVAGCSADGDCAPDARCDLIRGLCRRACSVGGSECTDTEACIAGRCEQPGS